MYFRSSLLSTRKEGEKYVCICRIPQSPDFEKSSPALQVFVLIGLNLLLRVSCTRQTRAIFTPYRIAFSADPKSHLAWAQNWNKSLTYIAPERLAGRVWWTKSQSSLLNIYFHLIGSQPSLLIIHIRYGPNTCSHCTKVWHRTHPICHARLSRSAWRSFAPLQKSRRNHRS